MSKVPVYYCRELLKKEGKLQRGEGSSEEVSSRGSALHFERQRLENRLALRFTTSPRYSPGRASFANFNFTLIPLTSRFPIIDYSYSAVRKYDSPARAAEKRFSRRFFPSKRLSLLDDSPIRRRCLRRPRPRRRLYVRRRTLRLSPRQVVPSDARFPYSAFPARRAHFRTSLRARIRNFRADFLSAPGIIAGAQIAAAAAGHAPKVRPAGP